MIENSLTTREVESIVTTAISEISAKGPTDDSVMEKLAHIKHFYPQVLKKHERKLLYVMGLFYKTGKPRGVIEEIYSSFSSAINSETDHHFTPVQASAYRSIINHEYFSFSAPTSSGKSHLFRTLIKSSDKDIVIVVPSRALISEFYFETIDLVDNDVLVLQFIDDVNRKHTSRRIFIVTPERAGELFKYKSTFNIGLFLLDEAHISEENIRGLKFDALVRRISKSFPDAKKVFAHPFVANPDAQLKKHGFKERTKSAFYDQHVVGKIYMFVEDSRFLFFSPHTKNQSRECEKNIPLEVIKKNGTLLVYISKEKIFDGRYLTEFEEYINACPAITNRYAKSIIEKLREYIGASVDEGEKKSTLISMMKRGVVVHHGSIPLKARLLIEEYVNLGFAKICFATSTLNQGINMPFDIVWIDNYYSMDVLTLKNLIGRSGRSTKDKDKFDYGYTVIKRENVTSFSDRISTLFNISDTSTLDNPEDNIPEDLIDIVDAVKNDTFDTELNITKSQIDRIANANIDGDLQYILENMLIDGKPITGRVYYDLGDSRRRKIKDCMKNIYLSHMRRQEMTMAEKIVLSTAIPILLWSIQGRSFSEIVSLRYAYLSNKKEISILKNSHKSGEITKNELDKKIENIEVQSSFQPFSLPNNKEKTFPLFPRGTKANQIDYDRVVYDTYDYLDKVIGLSIIDPVCAAYNLYLEKTNDARAKIIYNYVRYGTNDETDIWLLKYGFGFEDIEWIRQYVETINQDEIVFSKRISELDREKLNVISRYIY